MSGNILVDCPVCKSTLEINPRNRKVLQHWKRSPEESRDLFDRAAKVKRREEAIRGKKIDDVVHEMDEKKRKIAEGFDDAVKKAKREIDEGKIPENPLDMD